MLETSQSRSVFEKLLPSLADAPGNRRPPTVPILSSFQDPSHSICQLQLGFSSPDRGLGAFSEDVWWLVSLCVRVSAGSRTPSLVACVSLVSCDHKEPQTGWLQQKMIVVLVLEKSQITVSAGLAPPERCGVCAVLSPTCLQVCILPFHKDTAMLHGGPP